MSRSIKAEDVLSKLLSRYEKKEVKEAAPREELVCQKSDTPEEPLQVELSEGVEVNQVQTVDEDPKEQNVEESTKEEVFEVVNSSKETESVKVTCTKVGCKRKGPSSCQYSMCFLCCFEMKTNHPENWNCLAHASQAKSREEENRYIEESLLLNSKVKADRLFHFKEEKFTGIGQTVVLWCFRDFCSNPKWSNDAFASAQRKEQQKQRLKKRDRAKFHEKIVGKV